MAKSSPLNSSRRGLRLALLATSLLITAPAFAQLTTATVRGYVTTNAVGAPGATVTAVSVDTGATATATAADDGSYVLTGLRPGSYDINVTAADGTTNTQRVIVSVGQTATLDVDTAATVAAADDTSGEGDIVVIGTRLAETRTSEIGTNVSNDQIENLPQNNRNFLNFAALAPGIKVNQTDFRQTFSGGGVGSDRDGESFGGPQINVFIDGVSLKSNVQQGGIVGQDVSRGNPFSQLAVQEFRVITSNFKAEFEDAGTAIITAVTKSGTNELHGELFGTYQDDSLIERDFIQQRDNLTQPPLKRYQYGAALGGPIIEDRLFFFANYEANIQDRANNVVPGGTAADQAQLPFDVNALRGSFVSPFREHLGFAKLNYQISDNQMLEVSGSVRLEDDLRGFGGQSSRDRGESVSNNVYTGRLQHQLTGDSFMNEATVDFLKSDLSFGALGTAGFGRIYEGVIEVGGRASLQEIEQQGLTFRNNLSFTNLEWHGSHLIKVGAKLSFQKYRIGGTGPNANPQFNFRRDPSQGLSFAFPEVVRFGGGDPEIEASTTQVGLFVQDDWEVNNHLTLNLGLRWDFDSNAKNNDFVTPAPAVAALRALGQDTRIGDFFNVEDYISNGDRKADLGNFAPRIGFSYDLNGDQRTVLFGGFGRYYDRALFRSAGEESLLTQYRQGELFFSANGLPRNGRPTIRWEDRFLTQEGFDALLASLAADPTSPGTNELRAIPNDLKTPFTDQFSIGIRQRIGALRTSLTYNHTRGRNQIGYAPINRTAVPGPGGFLDFIPLINAYGNAVVAFNTRATRYHGVFVQIDKPYTRASGYGFGIAYTLAFSKERGFPFNFDVPNIESRPFVPNAGDERHRVVINGIVDVPLGVRLSGLATIGSGAPFNFIDGSNGFQFGKLQLPGNVGNNPTFMQFDFKLEKTFKLFGGTEFSAWAEVFNLFDRGNVARGTDCCGPINTRPDFVVGPPRSFQFGGAFRF